MSNRLPIQGEYPPDWPEINRRVCEGAGYRCIRCGHPYKKGEHASGEWSPCDEQCTHVGPVAVVDLGVPYPLSMDVPVGEFIRLGRHRGKPIVAAWRILTVHHLSGSKSDCHWSNLLALCQRCHLQIQGSVNPQTTYFLEHSSWFKPYAAAFYARKYENRDITREEAMARLDELLAYERLA